MIYFVFFALIAMAMPIPLMLWFYFRAWGKTDYPPDGWDPHAP